MSLRDEQRENGICYKRSLFQRGSKKSSSNKFRETGHFFEGKWRNGFQHKRQQLLGSKQKGLKSAKTGTTARATMYAGMPGCLLLVVRVHLGMHSMIHLRIHHAMIEAENRKLEHGTHTALVYTLLLLYSVERAL